MKKKFKSRPEHDEMYWFVSDDGLVYWDIWNDFHGDALRLKFNNCFATQKEALAAAKRVKKALKGI